MKTEQEIGTQAFTQGSNFNRSRYYLSKTFSIDNIVSTPAVFMKFVFEL